MSSESRKWHNRESDEKGNYLPLESDKYNMDLFCENCQSGSDSIAIKKGVLVSSIINEVICKNCLCCVKL